MIIPGDVQQAIEYFDSVHRMGQRNRTDKYWCRRIGDVEELDTVVRCHRHQQQARINRHIRRCFGQFNLAEHDRIVELCNVDNCQPMRAGRDERQDLIRAIGQRLDHNFDRFPHQSDCPNDPRRERSASQRIESLVDLEEITQAIAISV